MNGKGTEMETEEKNKEKQTVHLKRNKDFNKFCITFCSSKLSETLKNLSRSL